MKKIIIIILINSLWALGLIAQTGNLYSGAGAGEHEASIDDYTTIFGDSSLTEFGNNSKRLYASNVYVIFFMAVVFSIRLLAIIICNGLF